jgi:hypothetical protein
MSVAEIKAAIDALTLRELDEVSSHVRKRRWEDTPERRAELGRIRDEMEAGQEISLNELRRRHSERAAEGE